MKTKNIILFCLELTAMIFVFEILFLVLYFPVDYADHGGGKYTAQQIADVTIDAVYQNPDTKETLTPEQYAMAENKEDYYVVSGTGFLCRYLGVNYYASFKGEIGDFAKTGVAFFKVFGVKIPQHLIVIAYSVISVGGILFFVCYSIVKKRVFSNVKKELPESTPQDLN